MIKLSTLIAVVSISIVCAASTNDASDRVVEFLTNAHTGKPMRADDWLTRKARSAEKFVAFGGLDALVRQSTERAARFGGLESVRVVNVKIEGPSRVVTAEVNFKRDHREPENPAKAASEDMIWQLRVLDEDGTLKVDF